MSEVLAPVLTADDARALTDEVQADVSSLWVKLAQLYEGGAHTALGYASWSDYCAAEFDMKKATAYRLLHGGEVMRTLEAQFPDGNSPKLSKAVVRELTPLRNEPNKLSSVVKEVAASTRVMTANTVKVAVQRQTGPKRSFRDELQEATATAYAKKDTASDAHVNGAVDYVIDHLSPGLDEPNLDRLVPEYARDAMADGLSPDTVRRAGGFLLLIAAAMRKTL
jgi:hypothetical protein